VGDLQVSLRAGENFGTAVATHQRAFPAYFVSMIASAEGSGQLAPVLGQVSRYIERDIEAKRKIKSALLYPAIVVVLAFISVGVLVGFVMPRFVTFFDEFQAKLPLATRLLVSISKFVVKWGVTIAVIVLVLFALAYLLGLTKHGRLWRDRA